MQGLDERMLDRLKTGAGAFACGEYLAELDTLHRSEILKDAAYDRLRRKIAAVEELFEEAERNWNQTFYLMFFRTLGDKRNQRAYLDLARRATYAMVLRERAVPRNVEALLLGASGLLGLYRHDTYTLDLGRDFVYLASKYGIEPMDASAWDFTRIHPANHPVLRVAQAAAFFAGHDFVMERMLDCRTPEDAARLFGVEASAYWCTHSLPAVRSQEMPKRIGTFKANLLAINLVSILQLRLRQPHGQRPVARPRRNAARTHAGRRERLHARLAQRGHDAPQRLRIAGVAPARHRILPQTAVRGVSDRSAPNKKPHRGLIYCKKYLFL